MTGSNTELIYHWQDITPENWDTLRAGEWVRMKGGTVCNPSVGVYSDLFGEEAARAKYPDGFPKE